MRCVAATGNMAKRAGLKPCGPVALDVFEDETMIMGQPYG